MFKTFHFNFVLAIILCSWVLYSCSGQSGADDVKLKIAVLSDLHYYDATLGTTGEAFEEYLLTDWKMLAESEAITQSVVDSLLASEVQVVLLPGDLTKDGEKLCHGKVATYLKQLRDSGKRVYVIPGNHDIRNVESCRYSGNQTTRVENITAEEFQEIYYDFGYRQAITTDPYSLSYIVELDSETWLFGLDSCEYSKIVDKNIVSGAFSPETLSWIKSNLQEARFQGKLVFGMMHHGILEHFAGEATNPISADYVVNDWLTVSSDFAELGMHLVFTGHFHANDIVKKSYENTSFLFDVETGSVLTHPSPFRLIELTVDHKVRVRTEYVTEINYDLGGKNFPAYALDFLTKLLTEHSRNELINQYGIIEEEADMLAPIVASAFTTHYAGDERMPSSVAPLIDALKSSGNQIKSYFGNTLEALFTDLPPWDNEITIDLENGEVRGMGT